MAKTYDRIWWCTLFVMTAVLFAHSSVVWAGEPEMGGEEDMVDVDDEDSDAYQKMLELSAQGNQYYAEGRIEDAAATYEEAYTTYPQPILLKNQMITRFLLDECETAIELGEKFLDSEEGSDQDRNDVEQVFGNCSLALAKEAAEDEDYARAQHWLDYGESYYYQAGNQEEATALRQQVDERIADIGDPGEYDPSVHDDGGSNTLALTGWALTGLGVVSLAGGGIWTLRWNSKVSDMESAETRQDFDERRAELVDSYSTARWGIPTLYGVGLTAVGAGVGLLIWSSNTGGEGTASLQPVFDGDVTGATFSVRF